MNQRDWLRCVSRYVSTMQSPKLVITHPGGAHKDDFLACSVLMHLGQCAVERRIPTADELNDAQVAVVDIGGEFAIERLNFDHHHFSRDHDPTCALSLVLQALDLYELAKKHCDWLEPAEYFDSRGPNKTAEWLGIDRTVVSKLNSPIDISFLRRFAQVERLEPGEPLHTVMSWIGSDIVQYLEGVEESLRELDQRVKTFEVQSEGVTLSGVLLPRTQDAQTEPSAALGRWVRHHQLEAQIAFLAYPDRRGQGYGLSRFQDHPLVDFGRVESEPDVHFAHASGFVCKTSAVQLERLKELMTKAIVQPR